MSSLPPLRRIVTTHAPQSDSSAEPPVRILHDGDYDDPTVGRSRRAWSGDFPAVQNTDDDFIAHDGLVRRGGTSCRTTTLRPGEVTPMHRTSSLDYNIITHGTITLLTPKLPSKPEQWPPSSILHTRDDIQETQVNVGEVVVQRGTIHAWRNDTSELVRWTAVLSDAQPALDLEEAWVEEGKNGDGKGDVRTGVKL
ncbi:RmlC-like jelly roll fold [Phaffia rhodozyma]|uniref:RmlC-like jelly roll fold n=1 Tax=Phaffia rhodozyma TaxID=264483 RepID=A0A0F7SX20_PHARH|nr:RmlC-like jelly roll fold [Phaffia rhodozyma]